MLIVFGGDVLIYVTAENLEGIFQIRLRTGLDFKSAKFGHDRGEAEDWIKMRRLEI
jgi:hypothetical protein